MMSVIIEDENGWGVSFTSHNPVLEDFVQCASYEDANRLHEWIKCKSKLQQSEINTLKDVIASYENQSPVAWINREGTYVELSTKSTVYGSHTIPLIMQHEVVYTSNVPEIFPGTLDALNKLGVSNIK
jgi:hypothetical protein